MNKVLIASKSQSRLSPGSQATAQYLNIWREKSFLLLCNNFLEITMEMVTGLIWCCGKWHRKCNNAVWDCCCCKASCLERPCKRANRLHLEFRGGGDCCGDEAGKTVQDIHEVLCENRGTSCDDRIYLKTNRTNKIKKKDMHRSRSAGGVALSLVCLHCCASAVFPQEYQSRDHWVFSWPLSDLRCEAGP